MFVLIILVHWLVVGIVFLVAYKAVRYNVEIVVKMDVVLHVKLGLVERQLVLLIVIRHAVLPRALLIVHRAAQEGVIILVQWDVETMYVKRHVIPCALLRVRLAVKVIVLKAAMIHAL
jgi:hypothetical protein